MKSFYYFTDNVEERYNNRTIDNAGAGLNSLPNNWLHHNALKVFGKKASEMTDEETIQANGVLDYSEWTPPPLEQHYKNDRFVFDKPIVIINNSFNIEADTMPTRYFSIECLYEMFTYLTENNYMVVYRRPKNKELPTIDQNEERTLQNLGDIQDNVEGIGIINDYQLTKYFEDVVLFDDLLNQNSDLSYNEFQCMLYANCDRFISYVGGGGIISTYFGGTNIMWVSRGKEIRPGYFSEDSYYKQYSNCNLVTVFDKEEKYPHKIDNYKELLDTMRRLY